MISALLQSIFLIVVTVISLYKWLIIINSLLSWVKPDPYNPIVQMLDRLTRPAYDLVRKYIPTVFGGMDLAPIIIILALIFLETFLSKLFVGM
ncbi:MAG: YggT family protein [Campylobacteraceae bacterium]|nr:YggT family protein [Campylobacteraceae bacterium]